MSKATSETRSISRTTVRPPTPPGTSTFSSSSTPRPRSSPRPSGSSATPRPRPARPSSSSSARTRSCWTLRLDGTPLPASRYRLEPDRLVLTGLPDSFELTVRSQHSPAANKRLMGLYLSNGIFCTQCEAEGFRRITYFQDRPDVMARFRVRIEADRKACPVLLSNGNPVDTGELAGRPPLGLVGGPVPQARLPLRAGGRRPRLPRGQLHHPLRPQGRSSRIYSEAANIDQCHHAMASLKNSMKWDEDAYGLEYDLDLFQIVAVNDFNFGAMENKGLNIFNTSATLAKRETATDADFMSVERIIAHEYFHNWTGDRVTCRDWFQLTLKEGLTVFRDQQFSADMHSAAVKRIGDVALLRDAPVPRGRRPARPPDPPRPLYRDQQLLHPHGLREGCGGHPHDPHPDRRRRLPAAASTSTSSAMTARP